MLLSPVFDLLPCSNFANYFGVIEKLTWEQSMRTAWTMSVLSMIAMEGSENAVSMYLTKGTDFRLNEGG